MQFNIIGKYAGKAVAYGAKKAGKEAAMTAQGFSKKYADVTIDDAFQKSFTALGKHANSEAGTIKAFFIGASLRTKAYFKTVIAAGKLVYNYIAEKAGKLLKRGGNKDAATPS